MRVARAVIAPRKNAQPCKPTSAGAIARNEAVNASPYLGRALWRLSAKGRMFQRVSMGELFEIACRQLDWNRSATARIRFAEPRPQRAAARPQTLVRCNFCPATSRAIIGYRSPII